jgi:hypothetical protein
MTLHLYNVELVLKVVQAVKILFIVQSVILLKVLFNSRANVSQAVLQAISKIQNLNVKFVILNVKVVKNHQQSVLNVSQVYSRILLHKNVPLIVLLVSLYHNKLQIHFLLVKDVLQLVKHVLL